MKYIFPILFFLSTTGAVHADYSYDKNYMRIVHTVPGPSVKATLTFYTPYDYGVGRYTASGRIIEKGMAAIHPTLLTKYPYGTRFYTYDHGWIEVQDKCGGCDDEELHLDVYTTDLNKAINNGVQERMVLVERNRTP